MPVAITRRAYVEIIGLGVVKITTSIQSKTFYCKEGITYIDLVKLTESAGDFYARVRYKLSEQLFMITVRNAQDEEKLGTLMNKPGYDKARNFTCTIIED